MNETDELSSIDIVAEEMIHDITLKLLKINGFSPEENPIEFDGTKEDSQYSLIRDDILQILDLMDAYKIICLDCDEHDLLIPMHSCTLELDYETPNKEK